MRPSHDAQPYLARAHPHHSPHPRPHRQRRRGPSAGAGRGGAHKVTIPGQEIPNADFLLENGAAIKINSAPVLPHKPGQRLSDAPPERQGP